MALSAMTMGGPSRSSSVAWEFGAQHTWGLSGKVVGHADKADALMAAVPTDRSKMATISDMLNDQKVQCPHLTARDGTAAGVIHTHDNS